MNSQERILEIFLALVSGKKLSKSLLMNKYEKEASTIQRDMAIIDSSLYNYAIATGAREDIFVSRTKDGYTMPKIIRDLNQVNLNDTEIHSLLMILLASRSFEAKELNIIVEKLLDLAKDKKSLQNSIANEMRYYSGVSRIDLLDRLEFIRQIIAKHGDIEFSYSKNGQTEILQRKPRAIYFSDLYFYVLTGNQEATDEADVLTMNKFRINNMVNIKDVSSPNNFKEKYDDRFQGGVLRNQTNLAFLGKPITMTIEFYFDPVYVLDRFPNSKIISQKDDVYTIQMNVNDGYGVKMWLLGQGDMVKVLSPTNMREYVISDMIGALQSYGYQVEKN